MNPLADSILAHHRDMAVEHHAQAPTSIPGVGVDARMLPLIESLWARGIETMYSCQGEGRIGRRAQRRWNRDGVDGLPNGLAYILFADRRCAAEFYVMVDGLARRRERTATYALLDAPHYSGLDVAAVHFLPALIEPLAAALAA